jgi:hypothetical protein
MTIKATQIQEPRSAISLARTYSSHARAISILPRCDLHPSNRKHLSNLCGRRLGDKYFQEAPFLAVAVESHSSARILSGIFFEMYQPTCQPSHPAEIA